LNNGFLEDDYVALERSSTVLRNPLYLIDIPPETFRVTTYVSFGLLKLAFGYRPEFYHLFALLLHLANVYLLWRLVSRLTRDPHAPALAALFLAVIQNPQEAVMWLSAMNELWMAFFALAALWFWSSGRRRLSLLCYCAALLSKESAVMVLALVPLLDWWRGEKSAWRRDLLVFALPTAAFGLVFLATASHNALFGGSFYQISLRAAPAFLHAFHRLAFPWVYLGLSIVLISRRTAALTAVRFPALWLSVGLAPYAFLTYGVASRHLYSASVGAACLLGFLAAAMPKTAVRAFLAAFITVNLGYIWVWKDKQFEARAAPTQRLVSYLERRPPGCLVLHEYPGNPWIVKLSARLVPGWQPEMIRVAGNDEISPECFALRWDRSRRVWTPAAPPRDRAQP
jgi:hypothetical protein